MLVSTTLYQTTNTAGTDHNKLIWLVTILKEKLEQQSEEEKDVYETLIENSGCSRFHFALQDCYFEHNDWRKCQKEMAEFKQCMSEHSKQREKRSQEQR